MQNVKLSKQANRVAISGPLLKAGNDGSTSGMVFEHADWTLFRNLETLGQKAGVAKRDLPKLVCKELVDNACDAAGTCKVGLLPDGGMYVEDQGGGIPGGTEEVSRLFSINRPLRSSKLVRLPTRGALGNGLRVVCGAVVATKGRIVVSTGGSRYRLCFRDDGTTVAQRVGGYSRKGTRVEVWLGDGPWSAGGFDDEALELARLTILLAGHGRLYKRRSSAYWIDSDSFFELCQAAGDATVRELVAQFEGCSGAKAGSISESWRGRDCSSLSRDEADQLLAAIRKNSREVTAKRLGCVGKPANFSRGYARCDVLQEVEPSQGQFPARVPYVIEVWAKPAKVDSLRLCVNRTPTTAALDVNHDKTNLYVFGCGLQYAVPVGRAPVEALVNITTPHMQITTDGKAPDLSGMRVKLRASIAKAVRASRRIYGSGDGRINTEKARIETSLEEAINQASGDHQHTYSLRQLYYVVRPMVADGSKELQYNNFTKVVGDYETEHGPLPDMYRDPRGILYHPHLRQEIQLGTHAVDRYERPEWTFNKILYCEKEGIVSILRQARWPERHDCALLTSKGYASRAARDLLDLLGETDEGLTFFAVHDADAAGTMIYQALQEETAARGARNVKIINLGLEPWEGVDMGLAVEPVERKGRKIYPVADYVHGRGDGKKWNDWLQHKRIELNAMTTPQLIAWLDKNMEQHGQGRLVPPADVVAARLEQQVRASVESAVRDTILRENNFISRAETEFKQMVPQLRREEIGLPQIIRATLDQQEHAHLSWAAVVDGVAIKLSKPSS